MNHLTYYFRSKKFIMIKKTLFILILFFTNLFVSFSQVGIMLIENNITLNDFETYSKIRVYGSNRSIVEISYREANINEMLSANNLKHLIKNLSEQKSSVNIEFLQNIIKFQSTEKEKIISEDIVFLIKRNKDAEPGYRIFLVNAKEIKEPKTNMDYSVAIVPVVEIPLIIYVDGIAIRKISIVDVDVTYDKNPIINAVLRNDGTVTSSFRINLNISNFSLTKYEILKPKETKVIKFPMNIFGKYNISILVDYFSDMTCFEKEIEIKEITPIFEKVSVLVTNILPYLIIGISALIALIIIKKRRE